MCEPAGYMVENYYNLQYYNKQKNYNAVDASFQSSESLSYEKNTKYNNKRETKISDFGNTTLCNSKRETKISDYGNSSLYNSKRETRISDFGSTTLYNSKRETRISDFGSTTLYRPDNEFDTFLPMIESVVTDNDLSELADEFAEFGKSFSLDEISINKEESDPYFQVPKPKRGFSKKFKVEVDPQTKYTYNNLYNIDNEIYKSRKANNDNEIKRYTNDTSRLDIRYIQGALIPEVEKERNNPNENILKGLNDTADKRNTKSFMDTTEKRNTKSFMDINLEYNTFNNRISAITRVSKDSETIIEDSLTLNSKNRMSYQNQNTFQNNRPSYLTNHQPAQPTKLNMQNKNVERISASPKSTPIQVTEPSPQQSKTESSDKYCNYNQFTVHNQNIKTASPKSSPITVPSPIPITEQSPQHYSDSEESELYYDYKGYFALNKSSGKKKTEQLSVSAPNDKKNYMAAMKKVTSIPLFGLSPKSKPVSYLKSEIKNSIAYDTPERKVSTKMPKHKKKKISLFAHCCSSKAVDNSFYEENSRYNNKDLYIRCQREQMHSFEAKRINSSKNNVVSSQPTYMRRNVNPVVAMKEKTTANLIPNYLNKESNQDISNLSFMSNATSTSYSSSCTSSSSSETSSASSSCSSDSSVSESTVTNSSTSDSTTSSSSSATSSYSSNSESESSYSNMYERYLNEQRALVESDDSLNIDNNNEYTQQKSITIPNNQNRTQYIQSKKDDYTSVPVYEASIPVYEATIPVYETSSPILESPSSMHNQFRDISTSNYSYDTNASNLMSSSLPDSIKHNIKFCTTYELSQDGNWKLVERRYPNSEVLKVAIISKQMI